MYVDRKLKKSDQAWCQHETTVFKDDSGYSIGSTSLLGVNNRNNRVREGVFFFFFSIQQRRQLKSIKIDNKKVH